jgi:hypothetical protein
MCFLLSKNSYGRRTHRSHKKNKKTAAINTKPTHIAIIYAASAFGFLTAFAGEMLIKTSHYAQAAPYYHQSSFISLSIQQFFVFSAYCSSHSIYQAFASASGSQSFSR